MNRHTVLLGVLLLLSLAGNIALMLRPESPQGTASSPPPAIVPIPVATPPPPAYPATVASPAPEPAETALLRRRVETLEEQLKRTTEELLAEKEQRTKMEIPVNRDAGQKLKTLVDAKFNDRPLIEIMEALRRDAGLEFNYDPSLQPKLEKIRITLAMSAITAESMLQMMGEYSDFSFDVLNGQVWIRPREKK